MTDTVFAAATGAGRAAIAILRLTGPGCAGALRSLCGTLPAPRQAALRKLRDADGAALDHALVLWLPGPASFTGEDVAELHLHGSRAVVAAIAARLVALGLRPAEPGDFTRRAFLNGRMDLVAAEGLADLIDSETEAQRRQALRQMEGALGTLYHGWATRLRTVLAHQEALIDFPDEDLPPSVEAALAATLSELAAEMHTHLDDYGRGERLRDGLVIAVSGAPNVGKSSLVNRLAAREVAIVSPIAGTTRDVLEARLDLAGVPVTLIDTAGLRDTADPVEAEGVRRARARAAEADLVLHVLDATAPEPAPPARPGLIVLANKTDLAPMPSQAPADALPVSATSGAGLDALRARLATEITAKLDGAGPPLTRARHRAAVTDALTALQTAQAAPLPELRAEDLRQAMQALGRITGQVGVEDVLDSIFSTFCIGK